MTDKAKPPDPSRRRIFTWFTDRNAAGAVGAEAGKLARAAREAAQELAAVGEEAAAALTEALTAEDAVNQPALDTQASDPPTDAAFAANADLHAAVLRLTEQVNALQGEVAASLQQQRQTAEQLQQTQRLIEERLPAAQDDAERSDLQRLSRLVQGLIALFVVSTGSALYEGLVGDAVYAPLKEWLLAEMQTAAVQAQPASPLPTPEPTSPIQFTGPVQVQRNRMQDRQRSARERLEAGLLLDEWGVLPPGLDDFIAVPGARFRIARYPVTNFQFRRFVNDGGYGQEKWWRLPWWSVEGWERRVKNGWTQPRYWDNPKFNCASQPVVGVSWWETEAYCNWLNLSAAGQHYKPSGMRVRLPTREQWMLAARNGRSAPNDEELDYPWRSAFDATLANTAESELHQTTPVDMYPDGVTPAGVYDMTGNVWEWTSDSSTQYNGAFWAKGGSWTSGPEWTRASAAGTWPYIRNWFVDYGFRCVCVPISHG